MKRTLSIFVVMALIFSMAAMAQKVSLGGAEKKQEAVKEVKLQAGNTGKVSLKAAKVQTEETKKTATQAANTDFTLTGKVVSLNGMIVGGNAEVSAKDAASLFERAQPLVLKADNGKVYWVFNTDGSYAGKNLAKKAGSKIGIIGKVKAINGLRVIIAAKIVAL